METRTLSVSINHSRLHIDVSRWVGYCSISTLHSMLNLDYSHPKVRFTFGGEANLRYSTLAEGDNMRRWIEVQAAPYAENLDTNLVCDQL